MKKKTIFLSRPEIERIRNTAHILTEEEIKQHEAEEKRIREQLMVRFIWLVSILFLVCGYSQSRVLYCLFSLRYHHKSPH